MDLGHGSATTTAARDSEIAIRVVCGWCGRLLRECNESGALTSHGLCPRCAQVLDGPTAESRSNDVLAILEHRVNTLMCHVYQTRQLLLGMQQQAGTNVELLARVGQALVSVRQQERAVEQIQQQISEAQV